MDKNALKIASLAISATSLAFAIVSFFLLPQKIYVQIISETRLPETGTLVFLIIGVLAIAVAGAMSIFNDNGKKWIALQSVLMIGFVGCLVYNMIVL